MRNLLLVSAVLAGITLCPAANAAIVLDSDNIEVYADKPQGSFTQAVSVVDAPDQVLVVTFASRSINDPNTSNFSIAYGGTAMTPAGFHLVDDGGYDQLAAVYYLPDPQAGTHDVAVDMPDGDDGVQMLCFTLSGVDTAAPIGATAFGGATGVSADDPAVTESMTLTGLSTESLVVSVGGGGWKGSMATDNLVELANGFGGNCAAATGTMVPDAAEETISYTYDCGYGTGRFSFVAAEFQVVPEPATVGLLAIGAVAIIRRRKA